TTTRQLTPLSAAIVDASIPHMRGHTPIERDDVRLSVLLPVYNERSTIPLIVAQVNSVPVNKEIICVNDCSTDGTREVLDRLLEKGLVDRVIHKEHNEGKGA